MSAIKRLLDLAMDHSCHRAKVAADGGILKSGNAYYGEARSQSPTGPLVGDWQHGTNNRPMNEAHIKYRDK